MVALYKKKKEKRREKGLTVLNVHYDDKNSHTCDTLCIKIGYCLSVVHHICHN